MERSINNTARDTTIILFLACAFFALLWVPFEWISNMYSNQEQVGIEAWKVAQMYQNLWPVLVGVLLAGAFFTSRAQVWILGAFVPTMIAVGLISIQSFFSYYIPLVVLFVPGGYIVPITLIFLWPCLFYLIMWTFLKRWFHPYAQFTHSRLEHFALFSLFGVPEALCQFGLSINHDWYITFP